VTTETLTDPFDADAHRTRLATAGNTTALRASYAPGALPELEDMSSADLWDDLAGYTEVPAFRLRRLRAVAGRVPRGAAVLDIGIGWGEIIPMLRDRGVGNYTGIDFSEQIVRQVAAKYPEYRFLVGGLDQVQDTFDTVLALEVCEHILPSRIFDFYARIRRVLRNDGRLIVSVPVYENLKASTLRCPHCGHMHSRMGHVRAYTPELIEAELALAGFEILDAFLLYASFDHSTAGRLKRAVVDLGRRLLNLGRTLPLNIVLVARPAPAAS
jgi:2-polyprenyl-3-methyl-5-hydroxy-6-metoxy-1,4-benzoquinol methylase